MKSMPRFSGFRALYHGIVLLLLMAQTACSSSLVARDVTPDRQPADAAKSGFYDGSLTYQGQTREFAAFIPTAYDGHQAMPLIVALHGGLGTGESFEKQSHISRAANEYGDMVVYPNGLSRAWNAGSCCGPPARNNVDDVGFIAALVAHLQTEYRIDPRRIYGTGFSNGAMLLHRVGCEKPHLLSGIAAVSGGPMIQNCPGQNPPIPTLLVQGKKDPRIPWDGGEVNNSYRPAFDTVVGDYAARNRCDVETRQTYQEGVTTCWARTGCAASLDYCEISGSGHQWPGGVTVMRIMLGDNTDSYDASRRIVQFFDNLGQTGADF